MYLKKILRFRLPDDIIEALQKVKHKSEFVRCAIHEKMEREGLIEVEKMPF